MNLSAPSRVPTKKFPSKYRMTSVPSNNMQPQITTKLPAVNRSQPDQGFLPVLLITAEELNPSPEHELLLRATDEAADAKLRESIRGHGVLEPLLVTKDRFVIDGHRRLRFAIECRIRNVPAYVLKIRRTDHSEAEWLALLECLHAGTVCRIDTLMREKRHSVSPGAAVRAIIDTRRPPSHCGKETFYHSMDEVPRLRIPEHRRELADAVVELLGDLEEPSPASVSSIHYRLLRLRQRPLRNSRRSDSKYQHDLKSLHDLRDLVDLMRLAGMAEWDSIVDASPPPKLWKAWASAGEFADRWTEAFLTNYARDCLQGQESHVEILCGSWGVRAVVESVAAEYGINVLAGSALTSLDQRHRLRLRFERSKKKKLILICLADCGPASDLIVDEFGRSMREEFGITAVVVIRAGLDHAQADRLKIPPSLEQRASAAQLRKFVKRHGRAEFFDLEAVPGTQIQDWLQAAIRQAIDVTSFERQVELQKLDADELFVRRKASLDLLRGR